MRANTQNASWAKKLKVVDFNGMELIGYSLWHKLTYTSATTLALNFFQTAAALITDGNMKTNTLPAGHQFLIQAIRFCPLLDTRETALAAPAGGETGAVVKDMKELIYDGIGELFINEKPYGSWPLFQLPSGAGVTGMLGVVGSGTNNAAEYEYATNGIPDPRAVYTLAVPIPLPQLSLLRFTTTWDAAKTLSVGNSPIIVILDGQLLRPRTA